MKQSFLSSALSMFGRGKKEENGAALDTPKETKVYFEEGGAKYHTNAHCSGMRKPQYIPLSVAKNAAFLRVRNARRMVSRRLSGQLPPLRCSPLQPQMKQSPFLNFFP